nr:MAG: RNA-dependent RNA polymerase [Narnaviridae sp.]
MAYNLINTVGLETTAEVGRKGRPSLGPTDDVEVCDLAPARESRRPRGKARGEPHTSRMHISGNRRLGRERDIRARPCPPITPTKACCRASGKTKYAHRGCFPGGAVFQNLPSAPFWVDPDPCPALAMRHATQMKKQRENRFSCLADQPNEASDDPIEADDISAPMECARLRTNRRKVQKIVKLLRVDRSLEPVNPVPARVACGEIRSSLSSMYDMSRLNLTDMLSIKTSAKAETKPCEYCESLQENKMDEWTKERVAPRDVDEDHLEAFSKALRGNVERGWNRSSKWMPYIPNGHATSNNTRCKGGNWNKESFSEECIPTAVLSSGKTRIITLYSGFNVEVLTPLHHALYGSIRRKGWLLVGSPTRERLLHLDQVAQGKQWLSFDYIAATDNIKTAYVRRAVEILIERAEGLTVDEIRCLEVVANLKLLVGDDETLTPAVTGQPMGSPMSFPLLCLINKTVVDLALGSLLSRRAITVKEWCRHPCLINGDDLLTKDVSSGGLADAIYEQGRQVGLMTNPEKTLVSPEIAEINSTCFENCVLQKKTNVSALWMGAEVQNVIEFAMEAATTKEGFVEIVKSNSARLARAADKACRNIPHNWRRALLKVPVIRRALESVPSSRVPDDTNLFPVVTMPDGYDLTVEEEAAVIRQRVRAIRDSGDFHEARSRKTKNAARRKKVKGEYGGRLTGREIFKRLQPKKPTEENNVLLCLASEWEKKRKENLARADREVHVFDFSMHCSTSPFTVPSIKAHMGLSGIASMERMIKDFYNKRKVGQAHTSSPLRQALSPPPSYISIIPGDEVQDKRVEMVPIELGFGQPDPG